MKNKLYDIETIKLNTILPCSVSDGPGIRMVVFLQGCHRHCANCHNPNTWDETGGIEWSIEDLIEYIIRNARTCRLTISGGEPLEQYEAVYTLLRKLKQVADFDITLYTGYKYRDIPEQLIDYIDYVKTEPYIKDLRTTVIPFVGSSNQHFITIIH